MAGFSALRANAADREHRGERCQSSAIVSSHEGSNYTASFEMSLRRPSIPLANDAGVRGVRVLSLDLERLSVAEGDTGLVPRTGVANLAGHAYPGRGSGPIGDRLEEFVRREALPGSRHRGRFRAAQIGPPDTAAL